MVASLTPASHEKPDRQAATAGTYGRPGKGEGAKKAVKCDMCKDIEGGAACVRACPTGAAIRVQPDEFLTKVTQASL